MKIKLLLLCSCGALTGCGTNFEPKPLLPGNPASVQAEEAPRPKTSRLSETENLTSRPKAELTGKDAP